MLVADNRPEWCIADLAVLGAGGITVPAYTTNTVQRPRLHLEPCRGQDGGVRRRHYRQAAGAGDQAGTERADGPLHRAAGRGRRAAGLGDQLERCAGSGRPLAFRRPGCSAPAGRHGVLHLHVGHRRHAQGRDADPQEHHDQPRGRLRAGQAARPRRPRAVSLLPAALPQLRAHGRSVLPDLDRCRDLLRRGGRDALDQPDRGEAHDPHLRAPALRGVAAEDPGRRPPAGRASRRRCSTLR